MKTFIFLAIVIIGLFGYILFYDKTASKGDSTPSLEQLEKNLLLENDTGGVYADEPFSAHRATEPIQPISEDIAFEQVAEIILQINPCYRKEWITLNSSMYTLLPDSSAREAFAQKIARKLHLSDREREEAMRKNRILWDWVIMLR